MKARLFVFSVCLVLLACLLGSYTPLATVIEPLADGLGSGVRVKATVEVGAIPAAIALDEVTGKIYVASFDDGTVSVIDAVSLEVIAEISVGVSPSEMVIHSDTHHPIGAGQDRTAVRRSLRGKG